MIFKILLNLVFFVNAKLIELTDSNSVILRGPVDSNSVSKWISQLNRVDNDYINLYITSPGGSVHSGNLLVEQIKSLKESGKTINCIAEFAASMAFVILQSCSNRYGLESSVLMQHQMSLGIHGNIKNVNNYLSYLNDLSNEMNLMQSKRLGMSLDKFNSKVVNDWWVTGKKGLEFNIIDEIVLVKCNSNIINKIDVIIVDNFFNTQKINFSKCPLITEPLVKIRKEYLIPYDKNLAIIELKMGNYF